ncbi:hypothetical protein H4218_001183 [Coemansia sp. IMI 209128]|nr:hypothetical protein GGI06_002256 [Coemansia sp. S85]KAJ2408493.1 hypothetical protein GGI10_004834 [Coemansia sp. RSA 2530]KAJ2701799.1 hypothetical protein H4218_001183 [Coemansia sp. IMI 209128]
MLAHTISALTFVAACSATALPNQPAGTHLVLPKRCGGCGWYGGYGGYGGYGDFGFPFSVLFTNDFDRNSNRANFNENTFYSNNVHADAASDNVHSFNNANIIA